MAVAAARVRELLDLIQAKQSQFLDFSFALDPAFNARACVLGPRGENLRRIERETRVRVEFNDSEATPNFKILPGRASNLADITSAKKMVEELLASVRTSQESWAERCKALAADGPRARTSQESWAERCKALAADGPRARTS